MDPLYSLASSIGMVMNVYEDHIELSQKGAMGFVTRGLAGSKSIYFRDITSVQFKEAKWTAGFIEFTFAGSNDQPGGSIFGVTNENRFTFSSPFLGTQKKLSKNALEIKNFIEHKINEYRNRCAFPVISSADEIMKYKKLFDDGIISEDEFNTKKKELLSTKI